LVRKTLSLLGRLENLETAHQGIIHAHHCSSIVKLTTVVGRREQSYQLPPCKEFIPILDNLVSSADQIQIMPIEELGYNILTKGEGNTTIILPPSIDVLIGVTPQQVTQQASVGDVGWPDNTLDLIQAS
jgi:hypothetical protein